MPYFICVVGIGSCKICRDAHVVTCEEVSASNRGLCRNIAYCKHCNFLRIIVINDLCLVAGCKQCGCSGCEN